MKKLIFAAAGAFCADLLSKLAARACLTGQKVEIGKLLTLCTRENTGMALGLFSARPVLALILPPLVVALGAVLLRGTRLSASGKTGAGLVLGGFAGNYLERVLFARVTDFLYFPWLPWFVCNLADIAVCAGAVLLGWAILRGEGS